MVRRSVAPVVLAVALVAPAFHASQPARATSYAGPWFRVGAAVESLKPPVPVYSGGFGASPPITRMHDPLQVRAIYVSNGTRAVAFAVVDSQAEFAAYQEGPQYGITAARVDAAKAVTALGGPAMTQANIIVQGTHSHSAATLEGIWGPVPKAYLQLVHDQTVKALVEAAQRARDATLWFATVQAPSLDNINTQQTDSYPGWAQDGQVSVLRAVSPITGASIATFVNVPAHPDIVCGSCLKTLSADYFGVARRILDRELGGVNVVGPATLGREESPVQTAGIAESKWYGREVANLATGGLARARIVPDGTVSSTESMVQVAATNPALIALNEAWNVPPSYREQLFQQTGEYPIDRSTSPPYATGNLIATYLTAIRIGTLLYLSQPGEPFPEVRNTIRRAVSGADMVVALSKGQDDWGYYYPAWVWPFTFAYPSDHGVYNVAPQAGDQIIEQSVQNAGGLGFRTATGVPTPMVTSWDRATKPAIQALASPATGDAGSSGTFMVTLQAIYEPSMTDKAPLAGRVRWDFGDGTTASSEFLSFGQAGHGTPAFVDHAFAPGSYTVRVRGTDTNGHVVSWSLPVRVYPRLVVHVVFGRSSNGRSTLGVRVTGGDGEVLAVRWRLANGRVLNGRYAPPARGATAFVTDGTGAIASARSPW